MPSLKSCCNEPDDGEYILILERERVCIYMCVYIYIIMFIYIYVCVYVYMIGFISSGITCLSEDLVL